MATVNNDFGSRSDNIRETSKWLAVTFCAAGTVLFSGLSLNTASSAFTRSGSVWVLVLSALPLLAAAVVVREAAKILTTDRPSAMQVLPKYSEAINFTTTNSSALTFAVDGLAPAGISAYDGVRAYDAALASDVESLKRARELHTNAPSPERLNDVESAKEHLEKTQAGLAEINDCLAYMKVSEAYRGSRWIMLLALVVSLASIVSASVVDKALKPVPSVDSRPPRLVNVFPYNSAGLDVLNFAGCHASAGQAAWLIGGDFHSPTLLINPSDKQNGRCRNMYTWQPAAGTVVAVPA